MEELEFKWYQILSESDEITQGDILINFPIIKIPNYKEIVEGNNLEELELDIAIEYIDCIVLTQACDIAQAKPDLENIILCTIHDIKGVDFNKGKLGDCISGKLPQYYMLNKFEKFKCEYKEAGFNFHIVNFNSIEKVPLSVLKSFANRVPTRLRLLPPYREHLSQAFAKYFMRIGLPSDIDRESVYQAKGL